MKKILLLLLVEVMFKSSFGQFEGVLSYENDYSNALVKGKVITSFYEANSKARVESKNIPVKDGNPDMSSAKDQDILLFDFDKQKETTLHAKMKMAIITGFMAVINEQSVKLTDADISVQDLGQEKIGQYSSTHFVVTIKKGKKDIWITKDIGGSNIFYIGPYLYYPKGSLVANKLIAAGGDGVVVKWKVGESIGALTSYQKKSLPSSTFVAPSDYSVMER